tara:strand:- start:116757 stop:117353 length:597 start_codon:yes stop_codon:yes gene_type:complete
MREEYTLSDKLAEIKSGATSPKGSGYSEEFSTKERGVYQELEVDPEYRRPIVTLDKLFNNLIKDAVDNDYDVTDLVWAGGACELAYGTLNLTYDLELYVPRDLYDRALNTRHLPTNTFEHWFIGKSDRLVPYLHRVEVSDDHYELFEYNDFDFKILIPEQLDQHTSICEHYNFSPFQRNERETRRDRLRENKLLNFGG